MMKEAMVGLQETRLDGGTMLEVGKGDRRVWISQRSINHSARRREAAATVGTTTNWQPWSRAPLSTRGL
jgi:hypothetical protein